MTDNELIAGFMGCKHKKTSGPLTGEYTEVKIGNSNWMVARYDTSWDWLMPVVENIDGLDTEYSIRMGFGVMHNLGVSSKYCYCDITNWKGQDVASIMGRKTLIETVYGAVVEFIKWYNQRIAKEKGITI